MKRLVSLLMFGVLTLQSTQILFAQSAPSRSEIADYIGLHKAAHENDIDEALTLIKNGASLEVIDRAGRTPIIVAAFASNDEIVKVLAEAGADMNALDNRAYDVVTITSVANDLELLELVLDNGASSKNITSPYDGTALIAAAHLGHHQIVSLLVDHDAPLDHVNNLEWTALIEAVVLGDGGPNHTQTVEVLLNAGADQDIGDSQGVTPLEHAKDKGYQQMVKLFLDHKK